MVVTWPAARRVLRISKISSPEIVRPPGASCHFWRCLSIFSFHMCIWSAPLVVHCCSLFIASMSRQSQLQVGNVLFKVTKASQNNSSGNAARRTLNSYMGCPGQLIFSAISILDTFTFSSSSYCEISCSGQTRVYTFASSATIVWFYLLCYFLARWFLCSALHNIKSISLSHSLTFVLTLSGHCAYTSR